jgi:hypothetical protein
LKLANYISDLLYRYECVIVPDFGGFVTNNKSAKIDKINNTLQPPYKQITFNSHLINNDGLLANYIASADKIPYESALNFIRFEIESWKEKIKDQVLFVDPIGSFSLVDNKLHFEPQKKVNYLPSSFGLTNVVSPEIKREVYKREVEKLEEKAPILITPERRKAPNYLKYAAIFVLGLSAIGIGGKLYKDQKTNQQIVVAKEQQDLMDRKIENATFVISKPLPTLNLEVTTVDHKSFHVIAGAFRFPENAEKKLTQLKAEGYPARILGVNKWGLTIVSFDSYDSERDAINNLNSIKRKEDQKAWLLVQKF